MGNCKNCGLNPRQGHTDDCTAHEEGSKWARYRARKRAERAAAIPLPAGPPDDEGEAAIDAE